MVTKSSSPISEIDLRPWYKKKRYVVTIGVLFLAGVVANLNDDSSEYQSEQLTSEEDSQSITEGIMPNYVGFTATQVAATLDELGVRESEVKWPTRFTPRDEEFEIEAKSWTVCEQELAPGEEITSSYVTVSGLWLGWGKNCDEYKVVPNIVGLTYNEAFDLATSRGLSIAYSSGDDTSYCTQDIPAGTKIPAGNLRRSEIEIGGALRTDCEAYLAEQAVYEAEAERLAEEKAAREEQERRLKDPNTFEGNRRFINFHTEWIAGDIAQIDQYRQWLEAGAVVDDPNSFGGPILDSLFGDIPFMPKVSNDMWEAAPKDYQERWTALRERLIQAEEEYDEAAELRRLDVYSTAEVVPYIRTVRAIAVEALNLVKSMPYPQR